LKPAFRIRIGRSAVPDTSVFLNALPPFSYSNVNIGTLALVAQLTGTGGAVTGTGGAVTGTGGTADRHIVGAVDRHIVGAVDRHWWRSV
jgi:hypothetical protein